HRREGLMPARARTTSVARRDPEVVAYRRNAGRLTTVQVLHPAEKASAVAAAGRWHRREARTTLEATWRSDEQVAQSEARRVIAAVEDSAVELEHGLAALVTAKVPDLLGEAENEHRHVVAALEALADAKRA